MRLVLITHEPIAEQMSGPAIRVLEMARAVADDAATCIATPYPVTRALPPGVAARSYRFGHEESLKRIIYGADAVLVQGFTLYKFPFLVASDLPVIVDLYCPFQLENLEQLRLVRASEAERATVAKVDMQVLKEQLLRGDFFLCANERQRDLWVGLLLALGRVTPQEYGRDPDLRALIDVVPFGVPDVEPVKSGSAYRGTIDGIGADDPLVIWGGSVLEWQDPVTVVEAMPAVVREVPAARLVFPGGAHPNPEVPPMPVLERTRERARALGLLDTHVFFAPWVPYDRRANYLLEANVGVSAHRLTLETRFAWRTRMLDYIWAALPIVCTTGDSFGDMVAERNLGMSVPPEDAAAMAAALVTLLRDRERAATCRAELAKLRGELEWGKVVEPLRRFLRRPAEARRSPAAELLERAATSPAPSARHGRTMRGLRRLLGY